MRRSALAPLVLGLASLGVAATGTAAVASHVGFADGPFGVHQAGVDFVSDAGVTGGCGDGTRYCAADAVTRGQMATFLHRLSGNASGVAPSVDADRLDGLDSSQVVSAISGVEAEIVDGAGFAACPSGTVVVAGGYAADEGPVYVPVVDANYVDPETETDVWLVGLADPATGELAGTGVVQALCAVPGDVAGGLSASSSSAPDPADAGRMVAEARRR